MLINYLRIIESHILENRERESTEDSSLSFKSIFLKIVQETISINDYRNVVFVLNFIRKNLSASRNNDLIRAKKLIKECEMILEGVTDMVIYNILMSSHLSSLSYYYFKKNEIHSAISTINEAILVDEELELKGFNIVHLHKIQQLQNIGKIMHVHSSFEDWKDLIQKVIVYIWKGDTIPYNIGTWNLTKVAMIPLHLREDIIIEIISDILKKDFYNNSKKIIEYLVLKSGIINSDLKLKYISKWIMVKFHFYNKNYFDFNRTTEAFLKLKNEKLRFLKLSLLTDAYEIDQGESVKKKEYLLLSLKKLNLSQELDKSFMNNYNIQVWEIS